MGTLTLDIVGVPLDDVAPGTPADALVHEPLGIGVSHHTHLESDFEARSFVRPTLEQATRDAMFENTLDWIADREPTMTVTFGGTTYEFAYLPGWLHSEKHLEMAAQYLQPAIDLQYLAAEEMSQTGAPTFGETVAAVNQDGRLESHPVAATFGRDLPNLQRICTRINQDSDAPALPDNHLGTALEARAEALALLGEYFRGELAQPHQDQC